MDRARRAVDLGASGVMVNAFAQGLEAVRAPLAGAAAPVAVLGGGIGPDNAGAQADAAGGTGLLLLLGSRAYAHPDGVEAGVRATCEALR